MSKRSESARISFNLEHLTELLTQAGVGPAQLGTILGYGEKDEDTYHSYWSTVDALAAEVLERVKDGTDEGDALFEACDGNYWSIYTHAAGKALVFSDNDGAYFDEMGDEIRTGDLSSLVCTLAAYALMADVREKYSDLAKAQEEAAEDDDEG